MVIYGFKFGHFHSKVAPTVEIAEICTVRREALPEEVLSLYMHKIDKSEALNMVCIEVVCDKFPGLSL